MILFAALSIHGQLSFCKSQKKGGKRKKQDKDKIHVEKMPILILILAIILFCLVQIGSNTDSDVLAKLMLIISTVIFLLIVVLYTFSDVILPHFAAFLEKRHLSTHDEKIQINGCDDLWEYIKESAEASGYGVLKWIRFMQKEYRKQKKAEKEK